MNNSPDMPRTVPVWVQNIPGNPSTSRNQDSWYPEDSGDLKLSRGNFLDVSIQMSGSHFPQTHWDNRSAWLEI